MDQLASSGIKGNQVASSGIKWHQVASSDIKMYTTVFVSFVFEQTYSIGLVVTCTVTTFRGSVSCCGWGKVVVFPIFGMILISGLTFI